MPVEVDRTLLWENERPKLKPELIPKRKDLANRKPVLLTARSPEIKALKELGLKYEN